MPSHPYLQLIGRICKMCILDTYKLFPQLYFYCNLKPPSNTSTTSQVTLLNV